MPMLKINQAEFYYELHGQGAPLVLISGLRSDHVGWFSVLEKLSKQFQVLIFDNRGIGRTIDSDASFTVEQMADDVMQLVTHLGLCKPHIVGHSLGGAIAQVIAKNYAEKISTLALCNTIIKLNAAGRAAFTDILKLYQTHQTPEKIMAAIMPLVFSAKFLQPQTIELIQKLNAENPYPQTLSGYERQLQALFAFDSSSWVHEIKTPTLVIAAEQDELASPAESAELANKIANAKLVMLPTGHASQIEAPDMFVAVLQDFIKACI